MGRRLERHLDTDLIERIELGWRPSKSTPIKRKTLPRAGWTYRGLWRKAHRDNAPSREDKR